MSDIIWAINPANDRWDKLLAKFRRHAADLFESKSIHYHIHIPESLPIPTLDVEQRKHFWLLFKEMVANIARKVIRSFQAPERLSKDPSAQLTEKETAVLNLLAQGKSYAEIGKALFLSVDGVRYHIRHIYEKLRVHSSQEAVAKGLKARIIKPPR